MLKTVGQKLEGDLRAAEKILTEILGPKIHLAVGEGESLNGRKHVHRLEAMHSSPALPQTLIMKQARQREGQPYNPEALEGPAARLFDEWAGLQFLNEVCQPPLLAPRFYGGDRRAGILLMEDLGTGLRLDQALLGKDAIVAEKTVVALFETVGRMHAQSMGQQARYDELRGALGPTRKPSRDINKELESLRRSFKIVGMEPHVGFYPEWESILKRVNEPGFFTTYIHSDLCPDNGHWVGSDLRLVDFEGGQYAHALIDGAYPRIHFPTCWCVNRLPDAVVKKAERAYRSELAKGCPQVEEDRIFDPALVGICAYWSFTTFINRLPRILEGPQTPDLSTARQRVLLRLEQAAGAAEEFGYYNAIGETTGRMVILPSKSYF